MSSILAMDENNIHLKKAVPRWRYGAWADVLIVTNKLD
jgi:hypothetical protein